MKIARIDCPACNQPIEIPAADLGNGLKCPNCQQGFIPNKKLALITGPDATAPRRDLVRTTAGRFHLAAIFFFCSALVCLFFGVFLEAAAVNAKWEFLFGVAGLLTAAIAVELLAQVLFIRAAVEDIASK